MHGAGRDPVRQRAAARSSLPVFSTHTVEEAETLMETFCVHRYDGSYAWTGWPHDLDPDDMGRGVAEIAKVTEELRAWYWQWRQRRSAGKESLP